MSQRDFYNSSKILQVLRWSLFGVCDTFLQIAVINAEKLRVPSKNAENVFKENQRGLQGYLGNFFWPAITVYLCAVLV